MITGTSRRPRRKSTRAKRRSSTKSSKRWTPTERWQRLSKKRLKRLPKPRRLREKAESNPAVLIARCGGIRPPDEVARVALTIFNSFDWQSAGEVHVFRAGGTYEDQGARDPAARRNILVRENACFHRDRDWRLFPVWVLLCTATGLLC